MIMYVGLTLGGPCTTLLTGYAFSKWINKSRIIVNSKLKYFITPLQLNLRPLYPIPSGEDLMRSPQSSEGRVPKKKPLGVTGLFVYIHHARTFLILDSSDYFYVFEVADNKRNIFEKKSIFFMLPNLAHSIVHSNLRVNIKSFRFSITQALVEWNRETAKTIDTGGADYTTQLVLRLNINFTCGRVERGLMTGKQGGLDNMHIRAAPITYTYSNQLSSVSVWQDRFDNVTNPLQPQSLIIRTDHDKLMLFAQWLSRITRCHHNTP
ncbi:hypothetical protein GQR58_029285 [Nymphon striatum]|nr:hypothetical protein GQR58_029285 [Nymphon striatum]